MTGEYPIRFWRKKSDMFSSLVVPATVHTEAPSRSYALDTPKAAGRHKPLAVIEHRRHKVAPCSVARAGPGGHEDEHVHLAGLHDGTALRRRNPAKLDRVGVTQGRRRDGAAEVDVEAFEVAILIQESESRGVPQGCADHLAPVPHQFQPRLPGLIARQGAGDCGNHRE